MGRFKEYCKWTMLITEASAPYDVLGSENFQGQTHNIKVSIVRFRNDFSPRVIISSLNDPLMTGFVEYPDKQKAILAYLSFKSLDDVLSYMKRWQNVPTAYKFSLLLKDEGSNNKSSASTPTEDVPVASEDIPSDHSTTFSAPSIDNGRESVAAAPIENQNSEPVQSAGNENGEPSNETYSTAPRREIGSGQQPPAENAPEKEEPENRENLFK